MKQVRSVRGLAKLLGLSPSTVSLALRGHTCVAEETRARVWEAAEEHNYQPTAQMLHALTREEKSVQSVSTFSSSKAAARILYQEGIRAVVIDCFSRFREFHPEDWGKFVLASIGRVRTSPRISCIRRDEAASIRMICDKLRHLGFRRPGFTFMEDQPPLEDDRDRFGLCPARRVLWRSRRTP